MPTNSADLSVKISDEQLCRALNEGDHSAADQLVHRYGRLVRYCVRPLFLLGGDQEDLIQEGMLGLLKAARAYCSDRGTSFTTFAEHCIRNQLATAVRAAASSRHTVLNQSVSLDHLESPEIGFMSDPETLLIHQESFEELHQQLIQRLTPLERQVLALFLEGQSYKDIALHLQRSEKSVDNAVQRIRKKLQASYR